jgi:hypothetical protein
MNKYSYFLFVHSFRKYLHSIIGIGYKSVDCIRLLSLRHRGFPASYNFQIKIVIVIGGVHLELIKL